MENVPPNTNQDHDLHSALKSCEEITSAQTILNWIKELERVYGISKRSSEIVNSDERFIKFANNIVVATEKGYDTDALNTTAKKEYSKTGETTELINQCLTDLLSSNYSTDRQKLQCQGYQLKKGPNGRFAAPILVSTQKQYFFHKEWDIVRTIIGDELFRHLYCKYLFFEKTSEGSLVQFGGTNIFDHLQQNRGNSKFGKGPDDAEKKFSKCCKYNIWNENDHYLNNINQPMWNNMKSRTRIFYCTQFNRNNQFFKKHYLVKNTENKAPIDRAEEVYKEIFKVSRIRKELKNNVINIIAFMLTKVKDFNFNYYLSKSCPLPENWKERKQKILSMVDKTREEKAKYYEELFSYTIDNR